jgi:hypothetical protein
MSIKEAIQRWQVAIIFKKNHHQNLDGGRKGN